MLMAVATIIKAMVTSYSGSRLQELSNGMSYTHGGSVVSEISQFEVREELGYTLTTDRMSTWDPTVERSYLSDHVSVWDVLGLVGNVAKSTRSCWHSLELVRAISEVYVV